MTGTSTTTPTSTSPGTAGAVQLASSVAKVLAALHRLGEATAAGTATEAGLGYSTTTPKLRTLENHGLAEPIRGDGRILWRLTDAGRVYALQEQDTGRCAGVPPSTAKLTTAEASDTTTPAVGEPRPSGCADGALELLDAAPARADVPDDSAADSARVDADADAPQELTVDGVSGFESDMVPAAAAAAPVGASVAEMAEADAQAGNRRASGSLRGTILDILEANPDQRYKVSELCRLINKAYEGSGAKKASAGAVHNAATKLVQTGRAVLAAEKPATFALTDANTNGVTT